MSHRITFRFLVHIRQADLATVDFTIELPMTFHCVNCGNNLKKKGSNGFASSSPSAPKCKKTKQSSTCLRNVLTFVTNSTPTPRELFPSFLLYELFGLDRHDKSSFYHALTSCSGVASLVSGKSIITVVTLRIAYAQKGHGNKTRHLDQETEML
jgi:hypothetical protein